MIDCDICYRGSNGRVVSVQNIKTGEPDKKHTDRMKKELDKLILDAAIRKAKKQK